MKACTLFPIVGGKPSKLYKELYDSTGKDRKLTNLLYALSTLKEIRSMFTPSELNSQREPTTSALINKLGVQDIINEKANIEREAKSIGALNKKGEKIFYDDMNTILQTVYDFNDTHDKMKVSIKQQEEGFYMVVDTVNAENFNVNNSLHLRENVYNALLLRFDSEGLNGMLEDETKAVFSPLNIYYSIDKLKDLKRSTDNINMSVAKILVDIFSTDPLMQRLLLLFGDDLPQAISLISGYKYRTPVDVNDTQETLINNMLSKILSKLKKVLNTAEIDKLIETTKANTSFQKTYANTSGLSVTDTLKELYHTYHLDLEMITSIQGRVNTISEAANKLLLIRAIRLKEASLRGNKDASEERVLKKVLKDLDNALYLSSIAKMLDLLTDTIQDIEAATRSLDKKLAKHPEALSVIERYSSFILKQLDLVESFSPIMKQLKNVELLENDDASGAKDLIDDIKDLALELSNTLDTIEENVRKKQFDVVYAFLKIYWGEDTAEAQQKRGSDTTLKDIMEVASHDINMFDRFLYAANTTNDEMMNLIAEATKQARERRDAKLRKEVKEIRSITSKLYKGGTDSSFMFERDVLGYPFKIISDYDYAKYEQELQLYKELIKNDPNIEKKDYDDLIKEWIEDHTLSIAFEYTDLQGATQKLYLSVPIFEASTSVRDRLTDVLYEYWQFMMNKKALMIAQMGAVSNNTLFDVIEIGTNFTQAVNQTGGDVKKLWDVVKNTCVDALYLREDDVDYGSILDANGMRLTHVNSRGEPINTLPLFYTHKIKDRSRVSTDFSKSMSAYLATSEQYIEMNKILDALLLAKDWMMQRKVQEQIGGNILTDAIKIGNKTITTVAAKAGMSTGLKGLSDDFYERVVFNKLKKDEGCLWGTKIKLGKLADDVAGYTSITGLAVNGTGAIANALVGKLQMLIESGLGMGGEFFNMKDLLYADLHYGTMLGAFLNECNSNNKSSLLGLMMERFDVLDDFYDKVKETGFYKDFLSRGIASANVLIMYGLGEHLLHAQGMIATLHHVDVIDDKGQKAKLIDAFYVEKDDLGNGELKIKSGWTLKNGEAIDEAFLTKMKGRVAYVNKTMHGAFGQMDRGMIHRYALGRLAMNFRQWMPAHYSRRFRGRHYDSDLGEYREGYYVSTFKFLADVVKDLKDGRFQIATRWNELSKTSPSSIYNIKRTISEVVLLAMLQAALAAIGPVKDHKGNLAKRHLLYQLYRMRLEMGASTPFAGGAFIKNILTVLNSPMAAISTINQLTKLVELTDLFVTIENGKYKGENKYIHNAEKNLPFYSQIKKQLEMDESDDMFKIFDAK